MRINEQHKVSAPPAVYIMRRILARGGLMTVDEILELNSHFNGLIITIEFESGEVYRLIPDDLKTLILDRLEKKDIVKKVYFPSAFLTCFA